METCKVLMIVTVTSIFVHMSYVSTIPVTTSHTYLTKATRDVDKGGIMDTAITTSIETSTNKDSAMLKTGIVNNGTNGNDAFSTNSARTYVPMTTPSDYIKSKNSSAEPETTYSTLPGTKLPTRTHEQGTRLIDIDNNRTPTPKLQRNTPLNHSKLKSVNTEKETTTNSTLSSAKVPRKTYQQKLTFLIIFSVGLLTGSMVVFCLVYAIGRFRDNAYFPKDKVQTVTVMIDGVAYASPKKINEMMESAQRKRDNRIVDTSFGKKILASVKI